MAHDNRPLSPHLQVYRWQITMMLSILHRATGVFLSVGTLLLAAGMWSLVAGPEAWSKFSQLAGSLPGRLMLLAWSAALFYHLANGIRHMLWDTGWGFDIPTTYRTGWTVIVLTLAATAWAAMQLLGGGA